MIWYDHSLQYLRYLSPHFLPHCASGHKTITITIKTNERQIFSTTGDAIKARAEDAVKCCKCWHYLMAVKVTVHDTHRGKEKQQTNKLPSLIIIEHNNKLDKKQERDGGNCKHGLKESCLTFWQDDNESSSIVEIPHMSQTIHGPVIIVRECRSRSPLSVKSR